VWSAAARARGSRAPCLVAEQARARRYDFYFLVATPVAEPLLTDARTKDALMRYGFVAYWREKGWPALCRPKGADDFECGPASKTH